MTTPRLSPDTALRYLAIVVASVGAALVAVVSSFLVPLRVGAIPLPLCFLVVVAGNVAVIRFAHRATESALAIAAPCLMWFLTTILLATRRTEGDLVLTGGWVGVVTLFLGAMALAITAFLAIVSRGAAKRAAPTPDVVNEEETVTGHSPRGTM